MAKAPISATIAAKRRVMPSTISHTYPGVSPMTAPSNKIARMRVHSNPTTGGHLYGDVDRINSQLEARIGRQHNIKSRLRGPALAEEVFQTVWYGEEAHCSNEVDEDLQKCPDGDDFYWAHQPSLGLETTLELQERLQNQIRKFEYAYDRMCIAALRWHQLMEDVHDDERIRKMFLDMQMIRKLSGMDCE